MNTEEAYYKHLKSISFEDSLNPFEMFKAGYELGQQEGNGDVDLDLDLDYIVDTLCGSFDADTTYRHNISSSTTKCKCGREKWEHPKPPK
ncbi:MAG: hypothetical protein ACUZ8H_15985 [Candidatus Anammoxibacter sp.]